MLHEEDLEAEEKKVGDIDILIEPNFPEQGDVSQALEELRRYIIFSNNVFTNA